MKNDLITKTKLLEKRLKGMGRVIVAYSGGVDSTFLLTFASKVLGKDNVAAVTAVSETYPRSELLLGRRIARKLNVRHRLLHTAELSDKRFRANPRERCFYCKDELFKKLSAIARNEKRVLLDATNYSDRTDFRPGRKAAKKWKVVSPLADARFTKDDIRALSRSMKLPTWNLPAQACLASRFPYGTPLSAEELRRVEKGEIFLKRLGCSVLRLRHHGEIARIETGEQELRRFADPRFRRTVTRGLKKLGWRFITVDVEGYRTGSFNN